MDNNLVIDFPERIEDDLEDFKLDNLDEESNYTAAKIKVTRDPETDSPIVFYSQELSRNFKDTSDKFGKRHIIKAFTPANIKKEQEFFDSDIEFDIRLRSLQTEAAISFTLIPTDSFTKVYETNVKQAFADEITALTKDIDTAKAKNKAVKQFIKTLAINVQYTHRHYVADHEYIPYGEDIEAFLKQEIAKPIIRWNDSPQLGYEILPNKYFYQYTTHNH